jgi:hypothetical protein
MAEFRTIEIDFDVHKKMEAERRSFTETPNEVLRRLLGIKGSAPVASGRPWSGDGVTLPHGTELRMEYNGAVYNGRVEDGQWLVEGKRFNSPSGAAGVARTRAGKRTKLDGWVYWQVRQPGEHDWKRIEEVRNPPREIPTAEL